MPSPFNDSIGVIGPELTSGVSGFAVGARSKAACRKRNDLYQRVLSDLREIEDWKVLLGQQLNLVPLERFFDNLNHSVNLCDSENRHLLKTFEVPISLGNTAGNNYGFALFLGFSNQINELFLRWVLNCARVEETRMSFLHGVHYVITIVGEETCHVLTVTDVVRAAISFHKHVLGTWS